MSAQPTQAQVHINRPLTNLSIAQFQRPSEFVADQVFPGIPVNKRSDLYFEFDREFFNTDEAKKRAPGTESAGGGYEVSTQSYFCEHYGFHKDISDEIRDNTDSPLNADRNATLYVTQKMRIKREALFASTFMSTGVWTNEVSGASADSTGEKTYWSDTANADIVGNLLEAQTTVHETTGYRPNVLVVSRDVFDKMLQNDDLIDRVKAGQTTGAAEPSIQDMLKLFDIRRIVVGGAIKNTAVEGATESNSFIFSKKAALLYVPESPGIEVPSAGYIFNWVGHLGNIGNPGIAIKKFRMENIESDRIEAKMYFDMKKVSADLGYFFNDIIE